MMGLIEAIKMAREALTLLRTLTHQQAATNALLERLVDQKERV